MSKISTYYQRKFTNLQIIIDHEFKIFHYRCMRIDFFYID